MRKPNYTTQFERDLRLLQRRGKDIEKLKEVLTTLIAAETLAERHRDHPLKGSFKNRRECHVEPD
jgi:mRNA interferase YafQ